MCISRGGFLCVFRFLFWESEYGNHSMIMTSCQLSFNVYMLKFWWVIARNNKITMVNVAWVNEYADKPLCVNNSLSYSNITEKKSHQFSKLFSIRNDCGVDCVAIGWMAPYAKFSSTIDYFEWQFSIETAKRFITNSLLAFPFNDI